MRTVITNNTEDDRFLGYILPHGKTVAAGDSVVVNGDLETILSGGAGRYSRKTQLQSFLHEVAVGKIVVDDDVAGSSSSEAEESSSSE